MPSEPPNSDPLSTSDFSLRDEELQRFIQQGVDSVASLVKTTYGPRGMDKLVELTGSKNERVFEVTNSGTAVLDAIQRGDGFSHPIAAILVDAVDTINRDLHDGSTAAILLTQALLDRGYELIDEGLTPTDVVVGYALAAEELGQAFDELARPVTYEETNRLEQVARTTMGPRLGGEVADSYVEIVVDAIQGLAAETDGSWIDTKQVKVVTDPGVETGLHDGVIVTRWPRGAEASDSDRSLVEFDWDSQFPDPVQNVTVAIIDSEIDLEETSTNFGAGNYSGVHIDSVDSLERYREGFEAEQRKLAERLASLGVDILISQVRVDDDLAHLFNEVGVDVVDRVETPEADIDRLANATGATVVSVPDSITAERLGTAGRVYEHTATDEKWTRFTRCDGTAYTVTLRTPTEHNAEHLLNVVEDALEVTAIAAMDEQVLPGAGAAQMTAAGAVTDLAPSVGGREALAVAAFGAALEDTVRTLARNAGHDTIDVISELRSVRANDGGESIGLNVTTGEYVDAWEAGIIEPRRVLSQAVETGRTNATTFLATDAFLHPNTDLSQFTPKTEHR